MGWLRKLFSGRACGVHNVLESAFFERSQQRIQIDRRLTSNFHIFFTVTQIRVAVLNRYTALGIPITKPLG